MSTACGQCGQVCDGDDVQDENGQVYCAMCWHDYDQVQEADGVCVQCRVTHSSNSLCYQDAEGPLCCPCWCTANGMDYSEYAFQNACKRVERRSEAAEFQKLAAQLAGRQNVGSKRKVVSEKQKQQRRQQSNSRNEQRNARSEPQPRRNPPRGARAATNPRKDAEREGSASEFSSSDELDYDAAAADAADTGSGSDADTQTPGLPATQTRRIKKQAQLISQDVSSETSASSELSSEEDEDEHDESSGSKSKRNSTVNPGRRIKTKAKFIRDTGDGLGREAYDLHRYLDMC